MLSNSSLFVGTLVATSLLKGQKVTHKWPLELIKKQHLIDIVVCDNNNNNTLFLPSSTNGRIRKWS